MSKAHIKSSLAILNSPISIDDNTLELFHYDISPNGVMGTRPVDDIYDDSLICWLQSSNTNSDNTYIVDKSRYGNHGKVSSYVSGTGMNGQALRFNKANNVLTNLTLPDSGTIEVWHYPTSFFDYNTIWDNSINSNSWECWIAANGMLGARISPSGPTLQFDLNTLGGANKWYHIVQTWTKTGNIRLYVNGVLRDEQTLTWASSGTFCLGGCTNTKGDGVLESCCIFNRPLTADEIINRYNKSIYSLNPGGRYGNCIAIEEATTNLLYNVDFEKALSPSYSTRGSIYTLSVDTVNKYNSMNSLKIIGTGAGSIGTDIKIDTTVSALPDTEYTLSFYAKALEATTLTARYGDGSSSAVIEREWARYSLTIKTGSSISEAILLFFDKATTLWINSPQFEQKSFATSFVNGSREKGKLYYDKSIINLNSFTVSCWFNIPYMHREYSPATYGISLNWFHPIIELCPLTDRGADATIGFSISAGPALEGYDRKITLRTPGYIIGKTGIQDNTWYHMALTFNGTTYSLYIDGRKELDYNGSAPITHEDTVLMIGGGYFGAAEILIDELRIDEIAKAADEISSWYAFNAPFSPDGNERVVL